jgi:hypothetical protein
MYVKRSRSLGQASTYSVLRSLYIECTIFSPATVQKVRHPLAWPGLLKKPASILFPKNLAIDLEVPHHAEGLVNPKVRAKKRLVVLDRYPRACRIRKNFK